MRLCREYFAIWPSWLPMVLFVRGHVWRVCMSLSTEYPSYWCGLYIPLLSPHPPCLRLGEASACVCCPALPSSPRTTNFDFLMNRSSYMQTWSRLRRNQSNISQCSIDRYDEYHNLTANFLSAIKALSHILKGWEFLNVMITYFHSLYKWACQRVT